MRAEVRHLVVDRLVALAARLRVDAAVRVEVGVAERRLDRGELAGRVHDVHEDAGALADPVRRVGEEGGCVVELEPRLRDLLIDNGCTAGMLNPLNGRGRF